MPAKTSDDYKPCVVIFPGGKIRKANVLYTRLDSLETAKRKLAKDNAAWVSPEDYDRLTQESGTEI